MLGSISDQVHTITSDNGKEFANHEQIAKGMKCDFYFAHAYSSWERGTNENTNGLFRQYFPKNRDFKTITDKELIHAMKRLGLKIPIKYFLIRRSLLHLLFESSKYINNYYVSINPLMR